MANKKVVVGFLVLVIAATYLTITMNNVRIKVGNKQTDFYVNLDNQWLLSGTEYNSILANGKALNLSSATVTYSNTPTTITITRQARFGSTVIIDTYTFDGSNSDVRLFPISHRIEVFNGSGMTYRYNAKNLIDASGVVSDNCIRYGRNMEIHWLESPDKISKTKTTLKLDYGLEYDYEVFNIRMFDPAGIQIGYISDSCVVDRSCCEKISGDMGFVCFRNDSNSNMTNPYEPKDFYGNGTTYAYIGFGEGKFGWIGDDINNFNGWNGVGRTAIGQSVGTPLQNQVIAVPAIVDKTRNYGWGVITNGHADVGPAMKTEVMTVPINGYTVLVYAKLQCNAAAGCYNGTGVDFESKLTASGTTWNYASDIDGTTTGLRFNWTVSGSSYEWNDKSKWIIAFNDTPDNFSVSGTTLYFRWNASYRANVTVVAVFTNDYYEQNISDWLGSPKNYIDTAINYSTTYNRRFKYPSALNQTLKQQYYWATYNYRMNTFKALPQDWNRSAWGYSLIVAPNLKNYPALWIWDSYNSCIGLLSSCIGDGSQDDIACLDVCKQSGDVFVSKALTNTEWQRQIEDDNSTSAVSQQTGGWGPVFVQLWKRGAISNGTYYCNNVYNALSWDYIAKNSTSNGKKVIDANTWCRGDTSGDAGWDGSERYSDINGITVCNIDITGFMMMHAQALANISGTCNSTTASAAFADQTIKWQAGINQMWTPSLNDYCDLNSTYQCTYTDTADANSYLVSSASAWALLSNMSNISQDTSVMAHWYNTTFFGTLNVIPSLHILHPSYEPTGSDNWNGVVWAPPNIIAMAAMKHKGYTSNLTVFSNKILDITSKRGQVMGSEADQAAAYACAQVFSAPCKVPYVWGDSQFLYAVNSYDLFDFLGASINSSVPAPPPSPTNYSYTDYPHPTLFPHNSEQILANVNDSGLYQSYYDLLLSDTNGWGTFSGYCGASVSSCSWRSYRAADEALRYNLTSDSTSMSDAISGVTGFANFSVADYTALSSSLERAEVFGSLAIAYDYIEPALTSAQANYTVDRLCNLSRSFYDLDVSSFSNYVTKDNGEGNKACICLLMAVTKGECPNDANYTDANRWQGCLDMNEGYWRGYYNGTSDEDGLPHYAEYGMNCPVVFSVAVKNKFNSSYLTEYNYTLSTLGRDITRYISDENEASGGETIRYLSYGDANNYDGFYPHILVYFASIYGDAYAQWLLLHQKNLSDDYNSYAARMPVDLILFNNSITPLDPSGLSLEWRDNNKDRFIWRNNWTRKTDLVIFFGDKSEQSKGHPQQDFGMDITYKYPMLVDSGKRNGTNEIPSGTKWHNTLTVDGKGDMSWWEDASIIPSDSLYYFGTNSYLTFTNCLLSNFTQCKDVQKPYIGYLKYYSTSASYNEILFVKHYYTLTNNTRRIVYIKDSVRPFLVEKWDVTATSNHAYSFNFPAETPNISVSGNAMTFSRGDSNLQILQWTKTGDPTCAFRTKTVTYGHISHTLATTGSNPTITTYLNDVLCPSAKNITLFLVYLPYLSSESVPYTFQKRENSTSFIIDVLNSTGTYASVVFSNSNIESNIVYTYPALPTTASFTLNGVSGNRKYELGTTINATVTSSVNPITMCFDINDNLYGTNYVCDVATPSLEESIVIDKVSINTFNDSTTSKSNQIPTGVSYFSLNLNNTNVYDDIGNNNNGSVSGATWISSGQESGAFSFDGTDDSMQLPYTSAYNTSTAFTVSVWINPTDFALNDGVLGMSTAGNNNWYFVLRNTLTWRLVARNITGADYTITSSNNVITVGAWNHLVAQFNGTHLRMWTNNVETATPVLFAGTVPNMAALNITLGRNWQSSGIYNGSIDEFRLYNFALPTEQIQSIYDDKFKNYIRFSNYSVASYMTVNLSSTSSPFNTTIDLCDDGKPEQVIAGWLKPNSVEITNFTDNNYNVTFTSPKTKVRKQVEFPKNVPGVYSLQFSIIPSIYYFLYYERFLNTEFRDAAYTNATWDTASNTGHMTYNVYSGRQDLGQSNHCGGSYSECLTYVTYTQDNFDYAFDSNNDTYALMSIDSLPGSHEGRCRVTDRRWTMQVYNVTIGDIAHLKLAGENRGCSGASSGSCTSCSLSFEVYNVVTAAWEQIVIPSSDLTISTTDYTVTAPYIDSNNKTQFSAVISVRGYGYTNLHQDIRVYDGLEMHHPFDNYLTGRDNAQVLRTISLYRPDTNITSVTVNTSLTNTSLAGVDIYVSADGGSNWENEPVNIQVSHTFLNPGRDLRFKAVLWTSNATYSPVVSSWTFPDNIGTTYPQNLTIDMAGDGVIDYNNLNVLNTTLNLNLSSNASLAIQTKLRSCKTTTCPIDILFYSDTRGVMFFNSLNLSILNINPIIVNTSCINTTSCSTASCNIPMNVTKANLNISSLILAYYGNKNLTITAHTTDYSTSIAYNINMLYSPYHIDNPYPYYYVYGSGNGKNLVPYGQTASKPFDNITTQSPLYQANLWMKLNRSMDGCIQISLNSSQMGYKRLNTTCQIMCNNLISGTPCKIWYYENRTSCGLVTVQNMTPVFIINSGCTDCVNTTDICGG